MKKKEKKIKITSNVKKQYEKYVDEYAKLRKAGNVKKHQRKMSLRSFAELSEQVGKPSTTRKELIKQQSKTGELTKKEIKKLYEHYNEVISKGKDSKLESLTVKRTTKKGDVVEATVAEGTSRKFKSAEMMVKNMSAAQLIRLMIDSGMSREEALEEYGY